jgi:hypothetical protein
MTDKLCKDCKWCDHVKRPWWDFIRYYPPIEFAKCRHPMMLTTNPIDGSVMYKKEAVEYCSISRSAWYEWENREKEWNKRGRCGPEGRNWEPKE